MGMQQLSELPEGWAYSTLETVGKWTTGGTPSRKVKEYFGVDIPWVKSGDLNDSIVTDTEEKITKKGLDNCSAKLLPEGTISIALYGATIGKLGILGIESATNQACANCIPNNGIIHTQFLFYYLLQQRKSLIEAGQGGAQPNLTNRIVREWPLSFPPLAEQHRIVSAIEALFARLDAANERLDRVPEILKRFRQSVLAAACDGRLTEDWREENLDVETANELINYIKDEKDIKLGKKKNNLKNVSSHDIFEYIPKSWAEASLDEISIKITDGTHHSPPNGPEGDFKYITAKNIKNDGINLENITFISSELHNEIYSRCNPEYGDILLIKDGATTGIVTINNLVEPFSMLSSVALLKFPVKISNKYIMYCIRSPIFQSNILDKMGGAAITRLTLKKIFNMVVPLPPLPEQHEIVRRVDALFALADSIEAKVAAARKRTEKLRQSVLAKAFSGELVGTEAERARREGRDYEPADVLLERIKAQRGRGD
jgi:type I restriction enzyme S subunit